jgi:hypothetical protein
MSQVMAELALKYLSITSDKMALAMLLAIQELASVDIFIRPGHDSFARDLSLYEVSLNVMLSLSNYTS